MTGTPGVAVFGSSRSEPGSREWSDAETVGRRLALAGLVVINGGYGGTMHAVSKGAAEAGGHVVGVITPSLFPRRGGANPFVTEVVEAEDLLSRIGTMMDRSDGVIALPGSIGTAAELLIAWNHNHIERAKGARGKPTVGVGAGWRMLATAIGDDVATNPEEFHLVDSSDLAVDWVLDQLDIR